MINKGFIPTAVMLQCNSKNLIKQVLFPQQKQATLKNHAQDVARLAHFGESSFIKPMVRFINGQGHQTVICNAEPKQLMWELHAVSNVFKRQSSLLYLQYNQWPPEHVNIYPFTLLLGYLQRPFLGVHNTSRQLQEVNTFLEAAQQRVMVVIQRPTSEAEVPNFMISRHMLAPYHRFSSITVAHGPEVEEYPIACMTAGC